jgi:hypothetical protein
MNDTTRATAGDDLILLVIAGAWLALEKDEFRNAIYRVSKYAKKPPPLTSNPASLAGLRVVPCPR